MIVWLTSYPRSGNTLLRMMLNAVFDLPSYSKYDDKIFLDSGDDSYSAVGHRRLGEPWDEFYRARINSKALHLVKTHEGPLDDGPAIYVVRNGLAAVTSYQQFCRKFDQRDYPIVELVLGARGPYPSWGSHLDAWNPLQRPRTLILSYEELVGQPEPCLDKVAVFLGQERQRAWTNNFATLHRTNPDFFRRGRIDPDPGAMSAELLDLFDLVHGDWMASFGYAKAGEDHHRICRLMRASVHPAEIIETRQLALDEAQRQIAAQADAIAARRHEVSRLDQEIRHLRSACAEREDLIKRLNAAHKLPQTS